ncbi:MAG: 30S ribosome-binding factor RbfA [Pseudomonadota bacterium]
MVDKTRQYRIGDQIQRELSQLIRDAVRDPRISPMTTVSGVEVTSDLSLARVYVTVIGDGGRDTLDGLIAASGFLRKQVGARVQLRSVPALRFYLDETAERAESLNRAIAEARAQDAKLGPVDHPDEDSPAGDGAGH